LLTSLYGGGPCGPQHNKVREYEVGRTLLKWLGSGGDVQW